MYAGYYPTLGDLAKIATLFQNKGLHGDDQILYAPMLETILAGPEDRGLPTGGTNAFGEGRYHMSFWNTRFDTSETCKHYLPAMVGWGGNIVVDDPKLITPLRPVPPIEMTGELACPVLGLFGNDDQNPNRDHVDRLEERLKKDGKSYEFHRYDGAGHAFFNASRVAYRPEQAADGWAKVMAFYNKHLAR